MLMMTIFFACFCGNPKNRRGGHNENATTTAEQNFLPWLSIKQSHVSFSSHLQVNGKEMTASCWKQMRLFYVWSRGDAVEEEDRDPPFRRDAARWCRVMAIAFFFGRRRQRRRRVS
jgi:hypothetical protein